jgi:hypothetical protein
VSSGIQALRRRPRRWAAVLAPIGFIAVGAVAGVPGSGPTPAARASAANGEPKPYTDASVPAGRVMMVGASPDEANDETWGLGVEGGQSALVRYTPETGWTPGPGLLDSSGKSLNGFQLDQPEAFQYPNPSPLAGQMTPHGSGVLAGTIPAAKSGEQEQQVLLVRSPGGAFQETQPLPTEGEVALKEGEKLLGVDRAPLVAALDEGGSGPHGGALVVPVDEGGGVEGRVLHWDGTKWTSEAIEVPSASSGEFHVVAIGASSPNNAWLLAKLSSQYPVGSMALFRRHVGEGGEPTTWQPVITTSGAAAGEPISVPAAEAEFTLPNRDQSQVLTVTSEGVWVDGLRADAQTPTTMFFKPAGEAAEGRFTASWCTLPSNAPAGSKRCSYELPEPLTTARIRSFAWANPSAGAYGERVITGFSGGVSLRLNGAGFVRADALGASKPPEDVGGSFGSAFSSAREGWLGQERLPVHVTLSEYPSRLEPWPAAFRHALLALAPAPGQAVGSLSSEALAVGDQGEIARYEPGKGWTPESLLGIGSRHETPRLRAVAWPIPSRAYAVGDLGQMWIWRGETGLWEQDPATPLNFRGNLLGIAFDPNNSARGYAVGQSGALLSYGKTWQQEPESAIPQPARGANYVSIAFAGSEAIVAYRRLVPSTDRFEGGVMVNSGSGWTIDTGAAAAIGSSSPWAVAGLPDGGAAFSAENGDIFERQSAGAAWQPTPTPYPGTGSPGSIVLFRENGALRVVGSGSVPETVQIEDEAAPPPGFPPNLAPPYPIASSQEKGVLRQTANGWSDEEHELNNAEQPPGEYERYDSVYQPDPVAAVMVNSTGTQGWAVGGITDTTNAQLDTADVWRYPADGTTPTGVATAPVTTPANEVTFAIGGGAQCAGPCADRAQARIGPDVWFSHAVSLASSIQRVRAFLYTGARVTTGKTAGPATVAVPYERELARYAELASQSSKPVYVAPSPTDLDGSHTEATFNTVFSGFPVPFGHKEPAAEGLASAGRSTEGCPGTPGCQVSYYALNSTGSNKENVRVIVLDNTTSVGSTQLKWLEEELAGARRPPNPEVSIVIGNASLPAEVAAGEPSGTAVAQAIVRGGASAYFFDSPEQNVELHLTYGGHSIPAFGSGTLGYVSYAAQEESDFIGASGFLLTQIDAAARNAENVAPVTVKLIPNIGELALEAESGTLLRRSQAALFAGLARRPRSGNVSHNDSNTPETDPYIPIPSNCVGANCAHGILPEYSFTSSRTDFGEFVEPNLASTDPLAVEYGPNGKPNPDTHSGLFCAYNAGTTIVTVSAGGLSASLPVTIQAGSVRQPCGTTKLKELPETAAPAPVPPPPAPAPAASPAPASAPPPVPPPPPPPTVITPAAVVPAHVTPAAVQPPPFIVTQPLASFVPSIVPPPIPTPARPSPPSGTSAVEAVQREEQEESAPESVGNQASAYRETEHEPVPPYLLGVVVLAAFAGASIRGRTRRRGRAIRVAPATISSSRAQRRMSDRNGRWGL